MPGFLDVIRNPEAMQVLGTALAGIGGDRGAMPAIALSEAFDRRNEEKAGDQDTAGFLSAILGGETNFLGLAEQYPKARSAAIAPIVARMLSDRSDQEGEVRRAGLARKLREETAGGEVDAANQLAGEISAARGAQALLAKPRKLTGFLDAIGATGATSDTFPVDLPGTPPVDQTFEQLQRSSPGAGLTARGWAGSRDLAVEDATREAAQKNTEADNTRELMLAEANKAKADAETLRRSQEEQRKVRNQRAYALVKNKKMTREQAEEALGDEVEWSQVDEWLGREKPEKPLGRIRDEAREAAKGRAEGSPPREPKSAKDDDYEARYAGMLGGQGKFLNSIIVQGATEADRASVLADYQASVADARARRDERAFLALKRIGQRLKALGIDQAAPEK